MRWKVRAEPSLRRWNMIEDLIRSEEWNVVKLSNALKMTCVRLEVHKHKHGLIIMYVHSQFRQQELETPDDQTLPAAVLPCPTDVRLNLHFSLFSHFHLLLPHNLPEAKASEANRLHPTSMYHATKRWHHQKQPMPILPRY